MTDPCHPSVWRLTRCRHLAELVHLFTTEGALDEWRGYIWGEARLVGITSSELKAEIERQRSSVAPASNGE